MTTQPVKVKTDTPGVTVEIEATGTLDAVAKKALRLFQDAGGWPQPTPSAVGFSAERRGTWDAHPPLNAGGAS